MLGEEITYQINVIGNQGFICSIDYYRKAIKIINSKIDDPVYFVFSDDIDWCKQNLKIKHRVYFIDWNKGRDSYKDMVLMSKCKHNIIANSSFSWWGAWLNNNPQKLVIAPNEWVYELNVSPILRTWVKI